MGKKKKRSDFLNFLNSSVTVGLLCRSDEIMSNWFPTQFETHNNHNSRIREHFYNHSFACLINQFLKSEVDTLKIREMTLVSTDPLTPVMEKEAQNILAIRDDCWSINSRSFRDLNSLDNFASRYKVGVLLKKDNIVSPLGNLQLFISRYCLSSEGQRLPELVSA